jgi:hypothetical protein
LHRQRTWYPIIAMQMLCRTLYLHVANYVKPYTLHWS